MDDATRAELARLRRRAYAPDGDIAADPDAAQRLAALEDLALSIRPESEERMPPAAAPDLSDPMPKRRPGRLLTLGVVATLAVATVTAYALAAPAPAPAPEPAAPAPVRADDALAPDPAAEVLLRIPLDGSFGEDLRLPDKGSPPIPSTGPLQWAERLGEYYGWQLWIAGASGAVHAEHCLVVTRGTATKAHCAPGEGAARGELLLLIDYDEIDEAERPDGMAPGERLGFWWLEQHTITVLKGADIVPS